MPNKCTSCISAGLDESIDRCASCGKKLMEKCPCQVEKSKEVNNTTCYKTLLFKTELERAWVGPAITDLEQFYEVE